MGARSSRNTTQNNRSDGHLLEYFRNTFVRGGGGTNPPVYSVSPSTASVNEGSSVTFTVTTANVPDATTLYWSLNTVSGTINTSDFTGAAVTGNFTITSGSGSVVLTLANDTTTEGSESFQLQVRTDSTSGTIVATSSTVTIGDTSLSAVVTGGTIFSYGGKTIHVFTSSSPTGLVVSNGNLPSVEYVMVGGGGAGGSNYAGGGGAGGYLTGTFPLPGPGGPYPVTIGAGGNGVAPGNTGGNGTNTVFNSITAYAGGGGGYFNGGGPAGSDGTPGASGGGAGGSNVYQTVGGTGNRQAGTGTPIPQQGYPGAQGFAPQYFSTGGSGGGAGGAAASPFPNGGSGHDASPGGVGLQAPSTFRDPTNPYGTSGPNPGGFYFGGGGGAAVTHGAAGNIPGGSGGGGRGSGPGGALASGTANTGGGGGGNSSPVSSGNGGSGIVIIAY